MIEIKLNSRKYPGGVAQIDDEDYDIVKDRKWNISKGRTGISYAMSPGNTKKNLKPIPMHRLIMGITDSNIMVDHKDHDGLNNQKSNLRIATKSQNAMNRKGKQSNSKSKFKGVHNKKGAWVMQLQYNKIRYHIYCKDEIQAAELYNEMAIKHHGEFASLNVIPNV